MPGTLIALALALGCMSLLAACGTDEDPARVGELPSAAQTIFEKEPYESARWGYQVEDVESGDVSFAQNSDQLFVTGSTAKLFTVGGAYETLGTDHRIKTPVYALGEHQGATLQGDIVLIAMGDLAMGGRGAVNGNFNFLPADPVYADQIPGVTAMPTGNPLAGLKDLSAQIEEAGIDRIDGDVVIDDRLFQPFAAQGGTVTPIFVQDNTVYITIKPTETGRPAKYEISPDLGLYDIEVDVKTVKGDGQDETKGQNLLVAQDENDPTSASVTGTLEEGAPDALRTFVVPDPATYARALFVRELQRAGVEVSAPAEAPNDRKGLPERGDYEKSAEVASLTSPELSEFGSMILSTSYNDGANTLLCLLAVKAGSRTCTDGLPTLNKLAGDEAGVPPNELVLVDGQGGDPASVTPQAINKWIRWTTDQEWGETFEEGLPVMGERGDLKLFGADSPSRGKVAAKPGTSAHPVPSTDGIFFLTQSFAGFLDTEDGKKVFSVYVSGPRFADATEGLFEVFPDTLDVAAAFQRAEQP